MPNFPFAYSSMGNAYSKLKQHEKAIAAYKKIIDLDPTGDIANFARMRISQIKNRDKP